MIAGIDVSTKAVDIVLLDDTTADATWRRIPLEPGGGWNAARSLRLAFPTRSWFEDEGVWIIGIEDPIGRHAHTAKALGMVTGAALALIPASLTVLQIPAGEWKRETVGNGNAPKTDVAAWARDQWTNHPTRVAQDAYDAYAIAWATRSLNNLAVLLAGTQ